MSKSSGNYTCCICGTTKEQKNYPRGWNFLNNEHFCVKPLCYKYYLKAVEDNKKRGA